MKHTEKWDVQLPPVTIEVLPSDYFAAGQIADWGHKYLNAEAFYNRTRGEQACIFILDTAGTFTHPDLIDNNMLEYNRNFTNESGSTDRHGHGTHCAGIANGIDNAIGIIGVAPGAKLVACKVLNDTGSGSYAWIAAAIRYVADLPGFPYRKIISMSLGGSSPSSELESTINYAIEKGVIIVAAAGNRGYQEGRNTVDYPGRYPQVITVASIGETGEPSVFSSAGEQVDIAAPGERVYSTHLNGGYARLSGTSMATPHLAGVCALVLSLHPEIKHQADLERFLKEHATDIFDPGEDVRTGAGVPIADKYLDEKPPPPPEQEPEKPGLWKKIGRWFCRLWRNVKRQFN